MSFSTAREFAQQLDTHDRLAAIRNEFVIHDPNLIYLDGNSLGLPPSSANTRSR